MQNRYSGNLRRNARYVCVFLALFLTLCIVVVLNVNIGSVPISVEEIAGILFRREGDPTQTSIIWKIRLPRILMAAMLGGALSLSGFLLQTFFANPIAGPFVLGISSGAKMVVALAMIYFLERFKIVSSWALIVAAFVGSLISVGFILLMSRRLKHMAVLLVAGIMIGYICSAVTDFIITFAEDSDIVNLHGWSQGSFSGMSWDNVTVAGLVVGVTSAMTFLLSKPIGAYQLGEAYAQSMGIAVPHLVKRSLNTSRPIVVIPATFLGGAVFCMICDLIARTAFAPTELNISTVTSVLGAPVVIAMMLKRQKER